MRTAHSPGVPSGGRSAVRAAVALVAAAAALCVAAIPALALTSAAPELTLTQAVDRSTAVAGDRVTYTIAVGNTGSAAASAVTVDEVVSGDAGFLVEDGTGGTGDTFAGAPVVMVTRVLAGHYRWSYVTVSPGDNDVVRFSAIIRLPVAAASGTLRVLSLTSTASTAGPAAATVTTTVAPPRVAAGAAIPPTGSAPGLGAGFLALGGLGLILFSAILRRREEVADRTVVRRPARSR